MIGTQIKIREEQTTAQYRPPVGRMVDADGLVGAMEIAQRLAVSRPEVVHTWRRRHKDFPSPLAQLSMGLVWYWPDVERWARQTGRLR